MHIWLLALLVAPNFVLGGSIDPNGLGNTLSTMGAPKIKIDDVTSIDLSATDGTGNPNVWAGNSVRKGDLVATIEWDDTTNKISVYPDINNAPTPSGWDSPTSPPKDVHSANTYYWRAVSASHYANARFYGYYPDEIGQQACDADSEYVNQGPHSNGVTYSNQKCLFTCTSNGTMCSWSVSVSQVHPPSGGHCASGYERVGDQCEAPDPNATWGSDSNSVLYAGVSGFEPVQWDEDTQAQAWADVTDTCPFDDCKADMVPIESPNLPQTDYLQTTPNEVQYVQFAKIKEPDGTDSVIEQAVTIDKATSTVTSTVARKHANSTVTQAKSDSAIPIVLASGETPQQNGTDNGLLQEIADNTSGEGFDLTGTGKDGEAGTFTDSLNRLAALGDTGVIGDIKNVNVGATGGSCPIWTAEIPFLDTTLTIDSHCSLIAEQQGVISAAAKAAYSILAIIIILSA